MRISPEFSAHIRKTRTVKGASLIYLTMLFCERPDGPIKLEYMFEMRYRYSLGAIWCSFYSFPSLPFCHKRFHNR